MLTLSDPMDCSLPGPSVHAVFQARILEWIAMPFSTGSSQPRDWSQVSCNAGRFFTIWATRCRYCQFLSSPKENNFFSLKSFLKTSFVSSIWQLSPSVFLALMLTANFLSIDVTQIPDLLLPNPHICSLKIKALNIFSTFFLHLRPFFSFLFFFIGGQGSSSEGDFTL